MVPTEKNSSGKVDHLCKHLSSWLHASPWQYTVLIGISIECVAELPDDADGVIHRLLHRFPEKPSENQICSHLRHDAALLDWFASHRRHPRITNFNLAANASGAVAESDMPALETTEDLARWLGITDTELEWLADIKRTAGSQTPRLNHYHYQLIEKRRGGKRLIASPKKLLKRVQRQINQQLLPRLQVHSSAHGYRKNHSCLTHANLHTNRSRVFLFDITSCFHSIEWFKVNGRIRQLGYNSKISHHLTCLCTHRFRGPESLLNQLEPGEIALVNRRHLPQGAPTSPILSNSVMYGVDLRLTGLARSLDLNYSRYADDLAFSGNGNRDWHFLEPVVGSICLEEGFELNYRKSRILRANQRQKITGLIVNKKINIDRRDYDILKAILTNCVRHGPASQNLDNHPDFRAYLSGKISHVLSTNPSKGQKLLVLFGKIQFQ